MSALFTSLNAQPFISLAAHRFMWGYDDNLYQLAKGVLALRNESPLDKFGIMANVCVFLFTTTTTTTKAKKNDKTGTISFFLSRP